MGETDGEAEEGGAVVAAVLAVPAASGDFAEPPPDPDVQPVSPSTPTAITDAAIAAVRPPNIVPPLIPSPDSTGL
ncbi:hypothetical protein AB0H92_19370 [Streptomyces phaeochromogenes]|uniref:hypothetical protein n=1 Tax=Streptomyces phaeochromogenes TaxID=1923 RepID=UPI0033F46AD3